jgi:hypothetical protein
VAEVKPIACASRSATNPRSFCSRSDESEATAAARARGGCGNACTLRRAPAGRRPLATVPWHLRGGASAEPTQTLAERRRAARAAAGRSGRGRGGRTPGGNHGGSTACRCHCAACGRRSALGANGPSLSGTRSYTPRHSMIPSNRRSPTRLGIRGD